MKHHSILLAGIFFAAFAIVSGCTTTTDVTNIAPVSTGQIVGSVQLNEMDCTPSASYAGVSVHILGTSITAVSDSAGNFTLDSVPAGYLNLDYTKPGFQDYIEGSVEFVGAGTLQGVIGTELSRIKNWKTTLSVPTITKAYSPSASDTQIDIGFSQDSRTQLDSSGRSMSGYNISFFVAKTTNINFQDTSTYLTWSGGGLTLYAQFNDCHSGDTLYVVAYPAPCNFQRYSYYVGNNSYKTVFTGFGPPSNTVKVVLP